MEPDNFFNTYRRDEDENRYYSAVGRVLAFATRFEWNCRSLARMIGITENFAILYAPDATRDAFLRSFEGSLASQIKKIVPKFVAHPGVDLDALFKAAREARNEIAHELTVGIEHELEDVSGKKRILDRLRELAMKIAEADAPVCVALSMLNDDPLPSRIDQYPADVAEWVVNGAV